VTDFAAFIETVQAAVPEHPPPLQPENVDPVDGAAVSVTDVPSRNDALQVEPQSMPAGLLDTVPLPVPVFTTSSAWLTAPVPETGTAAGLPLASCAMLMFALLAPAEVGVNVIDTVQVAPAASVAPQVVVRAN
jgi:hypothetical protein